jgi:hypothetical protein
MHRASNAVAKSGVAILARGVGHQPLKFDEPAEAAERFDDPLSGLRGCV